MGKANVVADALSRKLESSYAYLQMVCLPLLTQLRSLGVQLQVADIGTLLASFYVHPLLVDHIKEGQKHVLEMIKLRTEIEGGRKPEFHIRGDGVIVKGIQMCLPEIGELKMEIMEEAHSSTYTMHPGSTKMYHTLREPYWWNGMKKEIANFVSECLTCMQLKAQHQNPP